MGAGGCGGAVTGGALTACCCVRKIHRVVTLFRLCSEAGAAVLFQTLFRFD